MRLSDGIRVGVEFARLQRSQWWSGTRIRDYQQAQLARMLTHAVTHVPHYRRLGINCTGNDPVEWLQRFPVLTKRDLQVSGDALLADGVTRDRLYSSRTSGSSGEPTITCFNRSAWLLTKYALKLRRMRNCGLGLGKRVLIVTEASGDKLLAEQKATLPGQGRLFHQSYISLHTPMEWHVDEIRRYRPDAIYAFPSYFSDLLDHCETHGIKLPPVSVVFTSSEVMSSALDRRMKQHFASRVCDIYGCTEFKELAWQCEAGRYHVNFESAFIECLPGDDDNTPGAVLLTTLVNQGMPLIRYRVGDLGRLHWTHCSCGREGPVLSGLAGREVEMLELPDGRRLSPYLLTTAVEDAVGLRQYQFVHTAPDRLEFRYAPMEGGRPDRRLLSRRLTKLLGEQMEVDMISVDAIPRTAGGKRKVFIRSDNTCKA